MSREEVERLKLIFDEYLAALSALELLLRDWSDLHRKLATTNITLGAVPVNYFSCSSAHLSSCSS
jgi:hypothetical protein